MRTYNRPKLHKKENPIMEEHNKKLKEALTETLKQRLQEKIHKIGRKCMFTDCEKCNK